MLRLAIQSNRLDPSFPAALQRAAELAIPHLAFPLPDDHLSNADPRLWRAQADSLGVTVPVVIAPHHASGSSDAALRAAAHTASTVGAHVFVTQATDLLTNRVGLAPYWRGDTAPPVYDTYDTLWVQLANRHIRLAVRNGADGETMTQPAQVKRVTDDLAIGWAVDIAAAANAAPLRAWRDLIEQRATVAFVSAEQLSEPPTWLSDWLSALSTSRCAWLVVAGDGVISAETLASVRATAAAAQAQEDPA